MASEPGEYPHVGELDFVNNRVDPSTGTLQIRCVFDNPAPPHGGARLLSPGLFVRVRIAPGGKHPALLVPQSAVGTDQGKKFLLVVNDQKVVENRPVRVGSIQPDSRQEVIPVGIVRGEDGLRPARDGESGQPSISASDKSSSAGCNVCGPA